jgi:hypothetical protein
MAVEQMSVGGAVQRQLVVAVHKAHLSIMKNRRQ